MSRTVSNTLADNDHAAVFFGWRQRERERKERDKKERNTIREITMREANDICECKKYKKA